jgi:hypothetical protein
VGALASLLPPVDIDEVEPAMGAIPAVGQHTDVILEEIGFEARTVADWREHGVI